MFEPHAIAGPCRRECCPTCGALRDAALLAVNDRGFPISLDAICGLAGIPAGVARAHIGEDPGTLVLHAYDRAAEDLFAQYVIGFRAAETWTDGLRAGLDRVLTVLGDHPATAYFCFVAVRRGDRRLLALRERRIVRVVRFLAEEHARREGDVLPYLQFELLAGSLFRALSEAVASGQLHESDHVLADEITRKVQIFAAAAA